LTVKGFKGYAFSSTIFRNQIRRLAQGTKVYSVSPKNFNESYISIPPKEEQSKIANLMLLIDQRIATQIKIIEKLKSLIKEIIHSLMTGNRKGWRKQYLRDLFVERKEFNTNLFPVYSVSVGKGIVNQIEYLGRSFAAKDTSNYNIVRYGDVIYTKSPTGDFPYGIVKQSFEQQTVAVSPLYGVYIPLNFALGNILHYYFSSPTNAKNYLHNLIQKGAKNTISITNLHFLDKVLFLPTSQTEMERISILLKRLQHKIDNEIVMCEKLKEQKRFILQNMFI
jgi:type I restriction enzyme S subunit